MLRFLACSLLVLPVAAQGDVDAILRERVENGLSVGIVVALVDETGTRYHAYGSRTLGGEPVDEHTLYEIGSISKVFTGILLADLVERGELELSTTVETLLPEGVGAPTRRNQSITLRDLVTHRSGLPRLPTNFEPADGANPYADYAPEQLYEFLGDYRLRRNVGSKYEYSNLGFGLLGHLLELHAGQGWEALVVERICAPLGMPSTRVTVDGELEPRLAGAHDEERPVASWDFDALAGAGALRSTAADLARFLAANMGLLETDRKAVLDRARTPLAEMPHGDGEIGYAWEILERGGATVHWHGGGTGGYRAFLGFREDLAKGVVVLSNSTVDFRDLGFHLLAPQAPLRVFRQPIEVAPEKLRRYAGRFRLASGTVFEFSIEDGRLVVRQEGASDYVLHAETESKFFYRSIEAQFSFLFDPDGHVEYLLLHQNGLRQLGKRSSRHEVEIDPGLLDAYVGTYRFTAGVTFEFLRVGDTLVVEQAGAPRLRLRAESPTRFFYDDIDAQFTFIRGADGEVNGLILHQFDQESHGVRIE